MDAAAVGGSAHRAGEQYRPGWASLLWLSAALLVLVGIGACRAAAPVIDPGPRPQQTDGTISGTVRGPAGTSSIEGRKVEVINVDTGERQSAVTSNTGGFTFKVKPGRYKVELTLAEGESIIRQPGIMNVNRSDVDAHADFIVGSVRAFRPRPAFRTDPGLGSPVA